MKKKKKRTRKEKKEIIQAPKACNITKYVTPLQMFSWVLCKIFMNNFFTEHLYAILKGFIVTFSALHKEMCVLWILKRGLHRHSFCYHCICYIWFVYIHKIIQQIILPEIFRISNHLMCLL